MKSAAVPENWADCFLREHEGELIALRRQLHAHPELSGAEHDTTNLIAERLGAAGIAAHRLPSGTGLIADLGSPSSRGVVAFRADIDALAMDDRKSASYRSRIAGRAHACGHDAHTVIALGLGLAVQ